MKIREGVGFAHDVLLVRAAASIIARVLALRTTPAYLDDRKRKIPSVGGRIRHILFDVVLADGVIVLPYLTIPSL
jgi:hypothetical protein